MKKFRKEAFAFILILLSVSKHLKQLDIDSIGIARQSHMPQVHYVDVVWHCVIVAAIFPVV